MGIYFLLLLSVAIVGCIAAIDTSCQPTLTQIQQTWWTNGNEGVYSLWNVDVAATAAAISSLSYTVSGGSFYQVWELVSATAGEYTLPEWRQQNGGIPQAQSHKFGYIVQKNNSLVFTLSSLVCSSSSSTQPPISTPAPTITPVTPAPTTIPVTPTPTITPVTAAPTMFPVTPDPTTGGMSSSSSSDSTIGLPGRFPMGECATVVVIDNYIVRNSPGQTVDQIKQKYAGYFADVQKFYQYTFKVDLQFTFYVEEGTSSFTDTLDGGVLLEQFSQAIQGQVFGNPVNQCLYHLLTARQPYCIGGLAYVGTACNDFSNTGLSVDGFAGEDSELVIRRIIHEIGHNFGGDHPTRYTQAPQSYSCSVGEEHASDRILRSARSAPTYQYLSQSAFISDCAVQSIKDSLSAFTCLYPIYSSNPVYPQTILCEEQQGEGGCHVVQSYNGDSACYNILAFNDAVSSFQVFPGTNEAPRAVGLTLYADVDCTGSAQNIYSYYSATLPPSIDNGASSFKFIVQ